MPDATGSELLAEKILKAIHRYRVKYHENPLDRIRLSVYDARRMDGDARR